MPSLEQILKVQLLADDLYEPAAVGVFHGKVYVGVKTEICRFDDDLNG